MRNDGFLSQTMMPQKKETNEVRPRVTLGFCLETFIGLCYEGWEPKNLVLSAEETEIRGVCGAEH